MYSGKFIVLDGPDGCGKSSQSKLLADWLTANGAEVVSFRDPGTTAIGEKVRKILLDTANEGMCVRTEMLLYMAARAQLWAEEIKPALENGKTVVLDRWVSSTCAYQGYAGGFGIDNVIKIADGCLERVWPDMTIVLDLDIETSAKRLSEQLDRMEQKGSEYHQKVRDGFGELSKYSDNVAVVNSAEDIETVHGNIVQVINDRLAG
jgi:dTMP kinase